jgi:hypothetical protein
MKRKEEKEGRKRREGRGNSLTNLADDGYS